MKAIQITKTGGPEAIRAVELDRPAPAAGQALVEVKAIGVNFIDIYYREGVYPAPLPQRELWLQSAPVWNGFAWGIELPGVRPWARMRSLPWFRRQRWLLFPPGLHSSRQPPACCRA